MSTVFKTLLLQQWFVGTIRFGLQYCSWLLVKMYHVADFPCYIQLTIHPWFEDVSDAKRLHNSWFCYEAGIYISGKLSWQHNVLPYNIYQQTVGTILHNMYIIILLECELAQIWLTNTCHCQLCCIVLWQQLSQVQLFCWPVFFLLLLPPWRHSVKVCNTNCLIHFPTLAVHHLLSENNILL